jgi:nucleotide-binding universal stress UspA family protein
VDEQSVYRATEADHMYERILVPLDGSPESEVVLAFAKLLPAELIYLLFVQHDAPQGREFRNRPVFRDADAYLERIGNALRTGGREVELLQTWGDPADRIIEAAVDADLIVMATHGRTGGERIIYGSVTDCVARSVSAPVLLVPRAHIASDPPVARVALPLDGSELAESAMPTAHGLARHLDVPLHLIRVVDPRRETAGNLEAARRYLRDLVERPGVAPHPTSEVRSGDVTATLPNAIEAGDLVVMASHGYDGIRRLLFGSATDAVILRGRAPVLVLRARAMLHGSQH